MLQLLFACVLLRGVTAKSGVAFAVRSKGTNAPKWQDLFTNMDGDTYGFIDTYDESCETPVYTEAYQCTHASGLTWTSGRNHVARLIHQKEALRKVKFKYWVFTDGDTFDMTCRGCANSLCCFNSIVQFLNDPMCQFALVTHLDPYPKLPVPATDSGVLVDCTDAMMNAFHREAVPVLLPYLGELEQSSWHESQALLFRFFVYCLRGASLLLNGYWIGPAQLHVTFPGGTNWEREQPVLQNYARDFHLPGLDVPSNHIDPGDCSGLGSRWLSRNGPEFKAALNHSAVWVHSQRFWECHASLHPRFFAFMNNASSAVSNSTNSNGTLRRVLF